MITSKLRQASESLWISCTQKIHSVSSVISQKIHELAPDRIIKPAFTRGAGFWSHPKDEEQTGFFSRLTDINSQREDWYKVSSYVAEFWCTISNAGFLYVGIKHGSPELIFAGVASTVSHAIPKQWLLTVDKIAAFTAFVKLAREYRVLVENPWLLGPIALLGINILDVPLARKKGMTLPHVAWHVSAAFVADLFLKIAK